MVGQIASISYRVTSTNPRVPSAKLAASLAERVPAFIEQWRAEQGESLPVVLEAGPERAFPLDPTVSHIIVAVGGAVGAGFGKAAGEDLYKGMKAVAVRLHTYLKEHLKDGRVDEPKIVQIESDGDGDGDGNGAAG